MVAPDGLKPVIWIQGLKEPDFKDFKDLMDFMEKSSQFKLQLSKESVTVLGHRESPYIPYKKLLKSVLELKNENEVKGSEIYQYLINKAGGAKQNMLAKDEIFSKWNYSDNSKFNGAEDDIVVYLTMNDLYFPAVTRARRLLVVITYGEKWQEEKRKEKTCQLLMMEEAVAQKLVAKFPF